jgi:hypothetical protein
MNKDFDWVDKHHDAIVRLAYRGFATEVDLSDNWFVFSSCVFVDRCHWSENNDDPRTHTKQNYGRSNEKGF